MKEVMRNSPDPIRALAAPGLPSHCTRSASSRLLRLPPHQAFSALPRSSCPAQQAKECPSAARRPASAHAPAPPLQVFTITTPIEQEAAADALVRRLAPGARLTYTLAGTRKYELPVDQVPLAGAAGVSTLYF